MSLRSGIASLSARATRSARRLLAGVSDVDDEVSHAYDEGSHDSDEGSHAPDEGSDVSDEGSVDVIRSVPAESSPPEGPVDDGNVSDGSVPVDGPPQDSASSVDGFDGAKSADDSSADGSSDDDGGAHIPSGGVVRGKDAASSVVFLMVVNLLMVLPLMVSLMVIEMSTLLVVLHVVKMNTMTLIVVTQASFSAWVEQIKVYTYSRRWTTWYRCTSVSGEQLCKLVDMLAQFKPPEIAVNSGAIVCESAARKSFPKIECSTVGEGRIPAVTHIPQVPCLGAHSTRSSSLVSGGSYVSSPTSEGPVGARARQVDSEEEWSCNVASEPIASKFPPTGCASVVQEEKWSCNVAPEPVFQFALPVHVFVAAGNNKKDPWAINKKMWILDGAASCHITNNPCDLFDVRELSEVDVAFTVDNNTTVRPTQVGKVQFGIVILTEVYLCAKCPFKIISEGRLTLKGVDINKFANTGLCQCFCQVKMIFTASMSEGLFVLNGIRERNGMVKFDSAAVVTASVYAPSIHISIYQHPPSVVDVIRAVRIPLLMPVYAQAPVKLQVCSTPKAMKLSVSSTSVVNISPQIPLCERAVPVVNTPDLLFDSDDHDKVLETIRDKVNTIWDGVSDK